MSSVVTANARCCEEAVMVTLCNATLTQWTVVRPRRRITSTLSTHVPLSSWKKRGGVTAVTAATPYEEKIASNLHIATSALQQTAYDKPAMKIYYSL
jgi:hypothetical protein